MLKSRLTRLRIFWTFFLLLTACVTVAFSWSTFKDSRGSNADAEVVKVENRGHRTFLTVRFTARDGQQCESYLYWSQGATALRAGNQVAVHHPSGNACINVRNPENQGSWLGVVVGALMSIVAGVGTYVAWRQPYIPPPRYADMP